MEMGRKSLGAVAFRFFGTGAIQAFFHWAGTTWLFSSQLRTSVRGKAMDAAVARRKEDGTPSSPVAFLNFKRSNA